jgi:hypothetical protein
MTHICKLCDYSTECLQGFCYHLSKMHFHDEEAREILRELFRRIPFPGQQEEECITEDDLKQIVSLPLGESMRMYIQLRNFNRKYTKYMNVIALGRMRAMVVSKDGDYWNPESTTRCANVILDCYVNRLAKFEACREHWNDSVARVVTELPTGIRTWDDNKRTEPLKLAVGMLQLLSHCEYSLASKRLPPLKPGGRPQRI